MRLQDQEGRDWYDVNQPYVGINIRRGIPEQSWVLTDGSEVLVATGIHRSGTTGEIDRVAVSIRSGRGRARLDRERSDLVATVAHELRSPLTGVRGARTGVGEGKCGSVPGSLGGRRNIKT